MRQEQLASRGFGEPLSCLILKLSRIMESHLELEPGGFGGVCSSSVGVGVVERGLMGCEVLVVGGDVDERSKKGSRFKRRGRTVLLTLLMAMAVASFTHPPFVSFVNKLLVAASPTTIAESSTLFGFDLAAKQCNLDGYCQRSHEKEKYNDNEAKGYRRRQRKPPSSNIVVVRQYLPSTMHAAYI
ncbi:uncharacterized protein J3R85_004381 [Psidium guajava]|nr:uncharacterized protein J3R85_004381 [Psidium guajava]